MIYTLTLNPALDYVVRLPALREGETNRAASAHIRFGGKGINVSRVLHTLGAETTALGFAAGFTGAALTAFLEEQGIPAHFIPLPDGLTRINVKLKTTAVGREETEINAPGPTIPDDALAALWSQLDTLTAGDTLVLAGSIPPSLPRDLYRRIMERLDGRGIRFVVDAEGESLTATLPYRPFLIKPNRAELEGLVGHPLTDEAAILRAAAALQQAGARNILVSLGGDGALLLDESGGSHRAPASAVTPVNTVGAGDSMVAGFLVGLGADLSTDSEAAPNYAEALRWGIAAGGATAASEELADRAAVLALLG
jgi:1-phosphofructokinase